MAGENEARRFEDAVARTLRALGYTVQRDVTLGDYWADMVAEGHTPGLGRVVILVECKYRSKGSIPQREVQRLAEEITRLDGAVTNVLFVTNARFSPEAQAFAAGDPRMRLTTLGELDAELKGEPSLDDGGGAHSDRSGRFIDEPPRALVDALADGRCVAWLGAGIPAALGYPTWSQFAQDLYDSAAGAGMISPGMQRSLGLNLVRGEASLVVDVLADELDRDWLVGLIRETYADRLSPTGTSIYPELTRLPLGGVITTNFDSTLVRAWPEGECPPISTSADAERLLADQASGTPFALQLHGSLEKASSLTIGPSELSAALAQDRLLNQLLETILTTKTLLFLGASLSGLRDMFEVFPRSIRTGVEGTRHLAVVAIDQPGWEAEAEHLTRRFGLQVFAYDPAGPAGFDVLDTWLTQLAELVEEGTPTRSAHRARAPFLSAVNLTGVGPFERFRLELEPGVNLLLGDNGAGKSTILRAIATALVGEGAKPWARRLLRSDRRVAGIELELSGVEVWQMAISQGAVGIDIRQVPSVPPILAEHILVLGFPAVRGLAWSATEVSSVEGPPGRSTEADLAPLISGAVDGRGDQLEALLVELDHRQARTPSKANRAAIRRMRDDLFRVMSRLASGMRVDYESIDTETMQVLVRTDDGVVPLGALSQGTVSLLAWVGVLVRRLYDVYPNSEAPLNERALVLVDEIDAHMHPSWQRPLIGALVELFPATQFVLATHSPLVVTGLDVSRITRLVRNPETKMVEVAEVPQDMAMGHADQVLTSPLFGLDTTLDEESQRLLQSYAEVLRSDDRSPEALERQQQLARLLSHRVPVPFETPPERRAHALVRALLERSSGGELSEHTAELHSRAEALLNAVRASDGR